MRRVERGEKAERLSWDTKLRFGAGDIYGGGAMTVVGFLHFYLLTDVVCLSPALARGVILANKNPGRGQRPDYGNNQ